MTTKKLELGIYKTDPEVELPAKQTEGSACFDIAYNPNGKSHVTVYTPQNAPTQREITQPSGLISIMPNERALLPTGYIFDIPTGWSLRLHARSSVALKLGLGLANSEAIIDSDYVDETMIMVINASDAKVTLEPKQRIAQAELVPVHETSIKEIKKQPEQKTDRKGGLGSTGEK